MNTEVRKLVIGWIGVIITLTLLAVLMTWGVGYTRVDTWCPPGGVQYEIVGQGIESRGCVTTNELLGTYLEEGSNE